MASSKHLVAVALLLFALIAPSLYSVTAHADVDAGLVMKRGGKGGDAQGRRGPHPAEAPKAGRLPRGAEAPEQEEGPRGGHEGDFGKGSDDRGKGRDAKGQGRGGKSLGEGLENGRPVGAPHAAGVKGRHPEGAPRPDSSSHHNGKPRFPRSLLGGRGGNGGAGRSGNEGGRVPHPASNHGADHGAAEAPRPSAKAPKGSRGPSAPKPPHAALAPNASPKSPKSPKGGQGKH